MTDPDARKRRRVDGKSEGGGAADDGDERVALDTLPAEELASRLSDKATPLHAMPYPDQLRLKREEVSNARSCSRMHNTCNRMCIHTYTHAHTHTYTHVCMTACTKITPVWLARTPNTTRT